MTNSHKKKFEFCAIAEDLQVIHYQFEKFLTLNFFQNFDREMDRNEERKVNFMITFLVLAFFISWLPYNVLLIIKVIHDRFLQKAQVVVSRFQKHR